MGLLTVKEDVTVAHAAAPLPLQLPMCLGYDLAMYTQE